MNKDKKDIEIIDGNGSNLEISEVYDHLNSGKPKCNDKKPKNVVVPKNYNSEKKLNSTNWLYVYFVL